MWHRDAGLEVAGQLAGTVTKIEFLPVDGGTPVRSGRETTQPNRVDTEYWATGLTEVYLEGALERALKPYRPSPPPTIPPPVFDGPASEDDDLLPAPTTESILNPFSVYRKGEALLRSQLGALSTWHLVNIVRANGLSRLDAATLNGLPATALIEIIVTGARGSQENAEEARRSTGVRE